MTPNQTETLKKGIAVQAKDNNTVGIISKLTTTYTGEPIANATVKVSDAQTGKKLAETKTKEDGSFEIFISDEYRGPKEFIIEISKGNEYAPKKIVSTIEDLDNLRKEGIPMTPIFSDDVLNEINSMVVPHDRKVISKRGYAVLDKLAYFMKQNPAIVIKLTGHTDIRGERNDNLSLSQELAETAKQYLVSKGISPSNIIARGYGDRYVINKCRRGVECSITEHMANNRIEIIVWKRGK
jgi:outer membrane protein OmpA-like peptidoglycan-associated protein